HAYSVLFGWVLMEQAGVPVPSIPLLLAAGTASAAHRLNIWHALALAMLASLIADSAGFFLGRRYGTKIVTLLCRFSLEAATCVAKTQGTVARRGATTLLYAKF